MSFAENTFDYLPINIKDNQFIFSTQSIPKKVAVTVTCVVRKRNYDHPNPNAYLLIFSQEKTFSKIVQREEVEVDDSLDEEGNSTGSHIEYHYRPTGGKLTLRHTDGDEFVFWINNVSNQHQSIKITPGIETTDDLTSYCYY